MQETAQDPATTSPAAAEPTSEGSDRPARAGLLGRAAFAVRYVLLLHLLLIVPAVLALCHDPYFFFRDDGQSHCIAGFCEIVRLYQEGHFPLVTDRSWHGGALAAEYQFGMFSPVQTALVLAIFSWDLPLHYGAALFLGAFALILATGSYVLVRSYRVSPPLAMMAALAATLNGWIVIWGVNWIPAVASFAWVPWAWWSMRRLLQSTQHRLPWTASTAAFVALVVLAGFPFTVLMVLLLAAWLGVGAIVSRRRLRACWPIVLSILLGLALSAPAWAMLIEYRPATDRAALGGGLSSPFFLSVPPKGYVGMILPSASLSWTRFASVNLPPAEMNVGIAPIVLLLAALLRFPRRLLITMKSEFFLLGLLMVLGTLPSLGSFRWMFRWLPLCFLALALVAARASQLARESAATPTAAVSGNAWTRTLQRALLIVLALQTIMLLAEGATWYARVGVPFLLVSIAWYCAERYRRFLPARWVEAMPVIVVVISSAVFYAALPIHSYAGQAWRMPDDITRTGSLDPSITYLGIYSPDDQRQGDMPRRASHFLPGNVHLYSGLKAINGYSPMQPSGLRNAFGLDPWSAIDSPRDTLLASGVPPGPLLRRMSVDGLAITRTMKSQIKDLPLDEFVKMGEAEGMQVFRRRLGKSPCTHSIAQAVVCRLGDTRTKSPDGLPTLEVARDVLLSGVDASLSQCVTEFDPAVVRVIEEEPDRVLVEVDATDASRSVLVSFARAWYPGYQASFSGDRVPCCRLDGTMPAVVLPPGSRGKLLLVYRPISLGIGLWIAGLTAVGLGLALLGRGCAAMHRRRAAASQKQWRSQTP